MLVEGHVEQPAGDTCALRHVYGYTAAAGSDLDVPDVSVKGQRPSRSDIERAMDGSVRRRVSGAGDGESEKERDSAAKHGDLLCSLLRLSRQKVSPPAARRPPGGWGLVNSRGDAH